LTAALKLLRQELSNQNKKPNSKYFELGFLFFI
jgi:hypothetical protein